MLKVHERGPEPAEESEPLIRKTPGVMGGEACIRNSRIAVWTLVQLRQQGMKDSAIRRYFSEPLTAADLKAAWESAAANEREIQQAMRENEAE